MWYVMSPRVSILSFGLDPGFRIQDVQSQVEEGSELPGGSSFQCSERSQDLVVGIEPHLPLACSIQGR